MFTIYSNHVTRFSKGYRTTVRDEAVVYFNVTAVTCMTSSGKSVQPTRYDYNGAASHLANF